MYWKEKKILVWLLLAVVFIAGIDSVFNANTAEAAKRQYKRHDWIRYYRQFENRARKPYPRANGKGKIVVKCPRQYAKKYKYSGYILQRANYKDGKYRTIRRYKSNKTKWLRDYKSKLGAGYWYRVVPYWKTRGRIIYGKTSRPVYAKNKLRYSKKMRVKAYAYTGHGWTASGKRAKRGRMAVDPRVIKLGTYVWVPGYGVAEAADTGGMIKGRTIDLYMDTHREVYNWGVRYKNIYILT